MSVIQDKSHPTGVATEPKNENKEIVRRARERKAHAAVQLRVDGLDPEEIAEVLGYPDGQAVIVAMELALENELGDEKSKEAMRALASKRLDRLVRSVVKKAVTEDHPEHLAANKRMSELIKQWTDLHGIAAPAEVTIHRPSDGEIAAWVAEVTKGTLPDVEEDSIFDADILEDDEVG